MWPFKKDTFLEDSINEIKSFRSIGERFTYLGVDCIMTGYTGVSPYGIYPCIRFDYVNKNGNIINEEFFMGRLKGLISENSIK